MTHQRKKRFVHAKIQGALALQTAFHWCLFLVAASGLLFTIQILSGGPSRPLSEHFGEFFGRYAAVLIVLASMIPAVTFQSIKLGNRVVGPLVRLRNDMNRIARGEKVLPIKLRKRDLSSDLIEAFNAMLVTMNDSSSHDVQTPRPVVSAARANRSEEKQLVSAGS